MASLHRRVLQDIRRVIADRHVTDEQAERLIEAIDKALKVKRSVKLAKARRVVKLGERKAEWDAIREKVLGRADGCCENCLCAPPPLECDHFFGGFGRRKTLQSVFTCWALCARCHRWKTDNYPSASGWLEQFIDHCREQHRATSEDGYLHAADIAQARLDSLKIQKKVAP